MYDLPSARGPSSEGRVFVCLSLDTILKRGDSVSKSLEPHGSTGFARSLTAPYLDTCFTNKDASLNRGSATIFPVNPEEVLGVLWLSTPPDPKGISSCQLSHRPCRRYAVNMVQRQDQVIAVFVAPREVVKYSSMLVVLSQLRSRMINSISGCAPAVPLRLLRRPAR